MPTYILWILALIAIAVTGCKGVDKVVTARLEIQHGTNRAVIVQPKDTTITRLELNPSSGLILDGYQSTGNAAAIAASEAQYRFATQLAGQMSQQNMQLFQWLVQGAGQKFGVNMPQGPAIGQPPFQVSPDAHGTNGASIRVVELNQVPPWVSNGVMQVVRDLKTNAPPTDLPPPK